MAFLHWREDDGTILPAGAVRHGKKLMLTGEGYSRQPGTFTVYRRFGNLQARLRERKEKPTITAVGKSVIAQPVGKSEAEAGPWKLPVPPRRIGWHLFFEDDLRNRSGELSDTRLVTIGAAILVPVEQFKLFLQVKITAAIDPVVRLSVLTPWGDEESFGQYIEELAEDCEETPEALREYLSPFLPIEPPEGWEFAIEQNELELDEGESAFVEIQLSVPTSGATTFALEVNSVIDGELVTVVSDPFVIEVPEDGQHASLLFGGDDGAGGGAAVRESLQERIQGIRVRDLESGSVSFGEAMESLGESASERAS